MSIKIDPSLTMKIKPMIGLTGSPAAQSVWDSNFKFVSHMNDNPDTSHIKDSTSNHNHGTKKGANEPVEVAGQVGKAQNFGGDDNVDCGDCCDMGVSDFTIETLIKADSTQASNWPAIMDKGLPSGGYKFYIRETDGLLRLGLSTLYVSPTGGTDVTDDTSHYVVVRADRSGNAYFYVDGSQDGDAMDISEAVAINLDNANPLMLGRRSDDASDYYIGLQDEDRISDIARTPGHIATTNKSLTDALITYSISGTTITLTIASGDVDEDLTDFPIYLNLSNSAGKGSTDLSSIFSTVGDNWQRLKLVSASNVSCPMEVVSWDSSGSVAEVHGKVNLSSSSNTIYTLTFAPGAGRTKITP